MTRSAAPSMPGRSLLRVRRSGENPSGGLQESTSPGRYTHGGNGRSEDIDIHCRPSHRRTDLLATAPLGHGPQLALVSGLLFLPAIPANAAAGTADLSVSGSVSPDLASGGETLTFMFTVHNEVPGSARYDARCRTAAGLTLTSISPSAGSCGVASSTLTCALGTLDKGQSDIAVAILVVTPDVDVETLFDVQGTVTASTSDPDDTNNALVITGFVEPRLRVWPTSRSRRCRTCRTP